MDENGKEKEEEEAVWQNQVRSIEHLLELLLETP